MKWLLGIRNMDATTSLGLFLLRVSFGLSMFLGHGMAKFIKAYGGNMEFADPLGIGTTPSFILAIFAEAGCSLLVILGLATRFAVIPLMITMLVAFALVHTADPWGK